MNSSSKELSPMEVQSLVEHVVALYRMYIRTRDEYGRLPLGRAVFAGELDKVRGLIDFGADMNAMVLIGRTQRPDGSVHFVEPPFDNEKAISLITAVPLIIASALNHVEIVRCLVQTGADKDIQDNGRRTALWISSSLGHLDIVKFLVEAGAGKDIQNNEGRTPLWTSANQGHLDIVKSLVEAGVNKDIQDNQGRTPLFASSGHGHLGIVKYLVEVGADNDIQDNDGRTPLWASSYQGNLHIVEYLVDAGANKDIQNNEGRTPLFISSIQNYLDIVKCLVEAGANKDVKNNEGHTPLWASCNLGHLEIVKYLVEAGAGKDIQNNEGRAPLLVSSGLGHLGIVNCLVKAGADKDIKDNEGHTPLWASANRNHHNIVKYLVKAGASKDIKDNEGRTALWTSSVEGHLDTVKCLVDAGAGKDIKDNEGRTALWISCSQGHHGIVKCLVEARADKDIQDNKGHTPLWASCNLGHLDTVKYLVEVGANKDIQGYEGDNALLTSSNLGYLDIVKCLVKAGARLTESAVFAASENGHTEIVEILIDAGAVGGTKAGELAFSKAAKRGYTDVCSILLKKGAVMKVGQFDEILQEVVSRGHSDVLQVIGNALLSNSLAVFPDVLKIPVESTPSIHSLLVLHVVAEKLSWKVEHVGSILPFRKVIGYQNLMKIHNYKGSLLRDLSSLPDDAVYSDKKISSLIKTAGIGNVHCIPNNTAVRVTEFIGDFVQTSVEKYNKQKNRPDITLYKCGSSAEGTKVVLPDEYDFMFAFPHDGEEKAEMDDYKDGYMKYSAKMSQEGVRLGSMMSHLYFVNSLLHECGVYHNKNVISDPDVPKGGGQANTIVTIKYVDPITSDELLVSTDLVPTVHFKNQWPDKFIDKTWMMDRDALKRRGFMLVAKPPHYQSEKGKAMREAGKEQERIQLWRISCPHLETEHIQKLEERVRDAYVAAKCLRNPDVCRIMIRDHENILHTVDQYVSSYHLKTVFLHNTEDFRNRPTDRPRCLIEMVYIIYRDLEACLAEGFLPLFWRPEINVFAGLKINLQKSLRVAKLMREIVGRMYLSEVGRDEMKAVGDQDTVMGRIMKKLGRKWRVHRAEDREDEDKKVPRSTHKDSPLYYIFAEEDKEM